MRILIAKYWTELCHLTVSIEFQSDSSSVYRTKNKKKINLCFDTLIEQKRNHSLSFLTIFALHTYHPSSQCVSCYYYNWHITTSNAHFFRPWRSINSTRNRAKATWEETFQRKSRFKWNDINRIPDDLLPDKTSHSYPAPCQRPRIQRKPKVHCGGSRQLPFYQDKGNTTGSPHKIHFLDSSKVRNEISDQHTAMHDAWPKTFLLWRPLSSPFAVIRPTDWFWSLHHGVATPQIDSPPCVEGNPIAIDRESIGHDHCILLFPLFHPSNSHFSSRTRSILSYIFNRPSPFLDHPSRFSFAPFILGKLSYAASTLVLVKWMIWWYFYK